MGHPDKTCRTCKFYLNGKGNNTLWPYGYGRCTLKEPEMPAHANSRACEAHAQRV